MNDWQMDKAEADRLTPVIKGILAHYLIGDAPAEEDERRNTDLVVLNMQPLRVACRVRKFEYYEHYGNEFTIRSDRPSGAKTELAKIVEGWGDYFFYGFASPGGDELAQWFLGDLTVFRRWYSGRLSALPAGDLPGTSHSNRDDSSSFRAFQINDLPPEFVIAWGESPQAAKI